MKTNSKFLTLIFVCALILTPKVESKVTLNNSLKLISTINTIISLWAAYYYFYEPVNRENKKLTKENDINFIHRMILGLIGLPTTYCLYKETKNNTFLPVVNAALCLYSLRNAIQKLPLTWSHATEDKKQQSSTYVYESTLESLYYALVAYQLNK